MMSGYVKDFFETLAELSKKKEIRILLIGVLIGLCIVACPARLFIFTLALLAGVALYVWYLSVKKGRKEGGESDGFSKRE